MTGALELTRRFARDIAALGQHDVPSIRKVGRRYSAELRHESPAVVLQFVRSLLKGGAWPQRMVAFETLGSHRATMGLLDDDMVEGMAEGLADWGSVDLFGVTVAGQAWREGRVSDTRILEWTRSPDRWRRRLSLVATVPLNSPARGGTGDARRTLRVCRMLLDDRDDMVVKAMSWALRELAKREPAAVTGFVRDHASRLAPRVRREVSNKLETGLKSPRLASGGNPASFTRSR